MKRRRCQARAHSSLFCWSGAPVLRQYFTRHDFRQIDSVVTQHARVLAHHLAFAADLRVSELVGLRLDQFERGSTPCVHVMG